MAEPAARLIIIDHTAVPAVLRGRKVGERDGSAGSGGRSPSRSRYHSPSARSPKRRSIVIRNGRTCFIGHSLVSAVQERLSLSDDQSLSSTS